MKKVKKKQELFWAGEFGNTYTVRNQSAKIISYNVSLFSRIFSHISPIQSLIEFGAGSGNNLLAIKHLIPEIKLSAVEINEQAVKELEKIKNVKAHHSSILNFRSKRKYDFVLTRGLLIHIDPVDLTKVYDLLYTSSCHYICIVEYYNPTPLEMVYRGNKGYLFKRDFCGELLDRYKNLSLVNYGFVYHRDQIFPQDDITWFLLEKN